MKLKLDNRLAQLPNEISIDRFESHAHSLELFISWPESIETRCPDCLSCLCIGKGRTVNKTVYHVPIGNDATYLTFSLHRYRCKECGRYFTEQPSWLHSSLKITMILYLSACTELQSTASIRHIAQTLHIPEKTVISIMCSVNFNLPGYLPPVLCIDEFKGDTGTWDPDKKNYDTSKFHCNISDGANGSVIDILPRIDLSYLESYMKHFTYEQRKKVKFFCTDMHGGFLSFAKRFFPDAIICVDMFHVVQMLNENINAVRRTLQNQLKDDSDAARSWGDCISADRFIKQYSSLKSASRLLLTANANKADRWKEHLHKNTDRVNALIEISPELEEAYNAMQEFHVIIRESSYALKRSLFSEFLDKYCNSSYEGIRHVANTFRRNRAYIQNSWKYGHSNAVCEGQNNRIKVIKRNAYGLHSFANFRQRILFACGSTHFVRESYTMSAELKTHNRHDSSKEVN